MNRIELRKLLDELGADLRSSVDNVKNDLAQASNLNTQLNTHFSKAQGIVDKLNSDEINAEAHFTKVNELTNSIEASKTSADSNLTLISESLASIQAKIKEMETAYEAFALINAKIEDKTDGLEASLIAAKDLRSEIVATKVN